MDDCHLSYITKLRKEKKKLNLCLKKIYLHQLRIEMFNFLGLYGLYVG